MFDEQNPIQFFTATILEWKHLLKQNKYKDIIINSLQFLTSQQRVEVFGFVVMPNHIHLIWKINNSLKRENVQRDFLKFTAQQIKKNLEKEHPDVLEKFRVNAKDRRYQFWERNPLSVDLYSREVLEQKLDYIHFNPVQEKWNLSTLAVDYKYSSIRFYEEGENEWTFLKSYADEF